jgi:phage gp29-like protein
MPIYDSNVSPWRVYFSPLLGLNLPRVVQELQSAEQGYLSNLAWTYKFVEKRDATLKSCVARRTSAIKKLEWKITVSDDENSDQDLAQAQQRYLSSGWLPLNFGDTPILKSITTIKVLATG